MIPSENMVYFCAQAGAEAPEFSSSDTMDTQALIDVAYIAKLAKVELTAEETERFSGDLNQVLAYVQQLEKWDTSAVEPMYHPLPVFDALRPDIPGESLSNEAAMANAPQQEDGQVRVPKVVESAH